MGDERGDVARAAYLRRAGVSLLLAPTAGDAPVVRHWGCDLGDLSAHDLTALARVTRPALTHSALDAPREADGLPLNSRGFTGTPALEVFRNGEGAAPVRLEDWRWEHGQDSVTVTGRDPVLRLAATTEWRLTDQGLVRTRTRVTNEGDDGLHVVAVRSTLPVAARATELLDLTGRWIRERVPQRHAWQQGTWARVGRHGRTGHDATLLLSAGTPGFGFRGGEVWSVHVAWSGDHATYAERTAEGECLLGGGEQLQVGEVALAAGEGYESPWLVGSWSAEGLDGVSGRIHEDVRSRTPRPLRKVLVNTWEATYFDHDLGRLTRLAEAAAEVGAERFVLDDGWFRGRRDDRRALGDWTVDPDVWPDGLHPLVARLDELGLDLGLWVEPEMVSPDSDLARRHPEWILRAHGDLAPSWRHQQVLDLSAPGAYVHVRDALVALLEEYPVAFLKWDHNRDLVDVPGARAQTLACYRLLDELRERYPDLEIESCASGGGRVDLGILERTDRVWASDTIDALERLRIQRWTGLLVPPEMTGSHLGGPVSHTTGRNHRLELRAATALLGHFGIEWDLSSLGPADREAVSGWVALHRRLRDVVASGRLVRSDHADPGTQVTGVVAPDRGEAWYVVVHTDLPATQQPCPVRLEGLDPDRRYLLSDETPAADRPTLDLGPAPLAEGGVELPGSVLGAVGVRLGSPAPETARVLHVRAVRATC
jgi:alpha-galactosidase